MLRGLANSREDVTRTEATVHTQRTTTFHRKASSGSNCGRVGPSNGRIRYDAPGISSYSSPKAVTEGLRFLVDTQTLYRATVREQMESDRQLKAIINELKSKMADHKPRNLVSKVWS